MLIFGEDSFCSATFRHISWTILILFCSYPCGSTYIKKYHSFYFEEKVCFCSSSPERHFLKKIEILLSWKKVREYREFKKIPYEDMNTFLEFLLQMKSFSRTKKFFLYTKIFVCIEKYFFLYSKFIHTKSTSIRAKKIRYRPKIYKKFAKAFPINLNHSDFLFFFSWSIKSIPHTKSSSWYNTSYEYEKKNPSKIHFTHTQMAITYIAMMKRWLRPIIESYASYVRPIFFPANTITTTTTIITIHPPPSSTPKTYTTHKHTQKTSKNRTKHSYYDNFSIWRKIWT